ncbi:MAG: hypothetical protein ACLR0U_16865 [Enterocloster clostridioformis]
MEIGNAMDNAVLFSTRWKIKTYTRVPGERGISGTLRERGKPMSGMLDITRLSGCDTKSASGPPGEDGYGFCCGAGERQARTCF